MLSSLQPTADAVGCSLSLRRSYLAPMSFRQVPSWQSAEFQSFSGSLFGLAAGLRLAISGLQLWNWKSFS